ncbi:MAG: hypothetical protein SNG84_07640 [Rikenellaceae bacterium]
MKIGNKHGLLDLSGREVVPTRYNEIKLDGWSFISVKYRNKWAIVDLSGKRVTPFIFEDLNEQKVTLNGKVYLVNNKGEICDKQIGDWLTHDSTDYYLEMDWKKLPQK